MLHANLSFQPPISSGHRRPQVACWPKTRAGSPWPTSNVGAPTPRQLHSTSSIHQPFNPHYLRRLWRLLLLHAETSLPDPLASVSRLCGPPQTPLCLPNARLVLRKQFAALTIAPTPPPRCRHLFHHARSPVWTPRRRWTCPYQYIRQPRRCGHDSGPRAVRADLLLFELAGRRSVLCV
jgi:hypothetical protein